MLDMAMCQQMFRFASTTSFGYPAAPLRQTLFGKRSAIRRWQGSDRRRTGTSTVVGPAHGGNGRRKGRLDVPVCACQGLLSRSSRFHQKNHPKGERPNE